MKLCHLIGQLLLSNNQFFNKIPLREKKCRCNNVILAYCGDSSFYLLRANERIHLNELLTFVEAEFLNSAIAEGFLPFFFYFEGCYTFVENDGISSMRGIRLKLTRDNSTISFERKYPHINNSKQN
jgi:hypothetical protein